MACGPRGCHSRTDQPAKQAASANLVGGVEALSSDHRIVVVITHIIGSENTVDLVLGTE